MKKFYIFIAIIAATVIVTLTMPNPNSEKISNVLLSSENTSNLIVYKSPTCGCCSNYVSYLKDLGFTVEEKNTEQTEIIKDELDIPHELRSCHTTLIGDYYVEGHIPVEGILKLIEENPDIDGIALPNMPSGSPGMPGAKEDFNIYQISDGEKSPFVTL